ncbi:uncharacterized protein LOC112873382 [Panicum hallii]|uniref:uncharacterized protein LOC112873382 n=1 Tax=Panicum hallii TaxID=206008 RepID=UPI000DF4D542|nr:uncharacterized protein LOC112873382 [Panicum hallii]
MATRHEQSTTPAVSSTPSPTSPSRSPRATRLTVAPTVFAADPDPQARIADPCVLAADPSGLFLVLAPPSVSERPPTEARVHRGPDGVERTIHVGRIPTPACFVLDVPSAAASRVPDPDFLNASCVGVIAAPGGRWYMVVEFQNIVGCDEATLIGFSSETGEWFEVDVANHLPGWIWSFDDVISHDGKLWWVDLAMGLLACDPFADQPDVAYVPLPKAGEHGGGRHACSYCSQRKRASRRSVQVSNGKFRCLETSCPLQRQGGAPKFIMHTLADPETAQLTPEYCVSFAEIWAGESYKAAGLPKKTPMVAFIHPKNPDVVYFFVEEYLFAVNMHTKKVVEGEAHMVGASSSSRVLAWELPPALTAGSSGSL